MERTSAGRIFLGRSFQNKFKKLIRGENKKTKKMKEKLIEMEAATSQRDVEDGQCDYYQRCDTIKEAQCRAKYLISGDYARHMAPDPVPVFRYARIMVDGECRHDYFAKGYNGEENIDN